MVSEEEFEIQLTTSFNLAHDNSLSRLAPQPVFLDLPRPITPIHLVVYDPN